MADTDNSLSTTFFEASRRFRRQSHGWYAVEGVTPAQLSVLWAIERDRHHNHCWNGPPLMDPPAPEDDPIPGAKVSALAHILKQAPPGISQRVNELEALGFAQRQPSRTDRRVTYICLTDAGRAILAEARRETETRQQRILDAMGARRAEQLIRYMNLYADAAEKVAEETHDKKEQAIL